ncbi:glycosyltransferase [Flavobacterium artemisiae]|uniref:Glycosyltransferase n=1 Tax=Flavobacterium artemisiae TaxID=2126556 RepID=A0ABW4H8P9_9FLAO
MTISFCIPTLNRADFLVKTLKSICSDQSYSSQFEICIYNNFSNSSYLDVENEIEELSKEFNIKYKKGTSRVEIDQSMFEAISPAVGEYLFLIGDDDYLKEGGLKEIFNLIKEEEFDLSVFNALRVTDNSADEVQLIGFYDKKYSDFDTALLELKEYCTYGNLLVKREYIKHDDFKYLFGTSHAYGCFWLSFFRKYEQNVIPKIIVPKESVVCLRYMEKNYDLMEVTFRHSDLEHKLFFNVIGEKSKKLLAKFESRINKRFSTVRFFVDLGISNNDLGRIKSINLDFYRKNKIKIFFSKILVKLIMTFKKQIKLLLKINFFHNLVYKK